MPTHLLDKVKRTIATEKVGNLVDASGARVTDVAADSDAGIISVSQLGSDNGADNLRIPYVESAVSGAAFARSKLYDSGGVLDIPAGTLVTDITVPNWQTYHGLDFQFFTSGSAGRCESIILSKEQLLGITASTGSLIDSVTIGLSSDIEDHATMPVSLEHVHFLPNGNWRGFRESGTDIQMYEQTNPNSRRVSTGGREFFKVCNHENGSLIMGFTTAADGETTYLYVYEISASGTITDRITNAYFDLFYPTQIESTNGYVYVYGAGSVPADADSGNSQNDDQYKVVTVKRPGSSSWSVVASSSGTGGSQYGASESGFRKHTDSDNNDVIFFDGGRTVYIDPSTPIRSSDTKYSVPSSIDSIVGFDDAYVYYTDAALIKKVPFIIEEQTDEHGVQVSSIVGIKGESGYILGRRANNNFAIGSFDADQDPAPLRVYGLKY